MCVSPFGFQQWPALPMKTREQWYKQIGSVLGEIAYAQISNDDAQWLLDITHQFCHLFPDLWATCGRPEAALRAVLRY